MSAYDEMREMNSDGYDADELPILFPLKDLLAHSTDECVKLFVEVVIKAPGFSQLKELKDTNDAAKILYDCIVDASRVLGELPCAKCANTIYNHIVLAEGCKRWLRKQETKSEM